MQPNLIRDAGHSSAAPSAASAIWNGVLFQKFHRFKYVLTVGLGRHGEQALHRHPVREGARVLDVGCGFGDTTIELARSVGPHGEAVGVDCAANFIAEAERDAAQAGMKNTRFLVRDVQSDTLHGPYQRAFSRFGTMFFASPVVALRSIRSALTDDGELTMVVWRRREDNAWLYAAEQRVRELVALVETNEPTCGPGPFSMASADLVSDQLRAAGFDGITLERFDCDICIGRDLDEAAAFAMELGPAGEIMRLAGPDGERRRPEVGAAVRDAVAQFARPDGVFAPSSTWIVHARRARNLMPAARAAGHA